MKKYRQYGGSRRDTVKVVVVLAVVVGLFVLVILL